MLFRPNPLDLSDAYKLGHPSMYDPGMTALGSGWTPRGSRVEGIGKVVTFGGQAMRYEYFEQYFEQEFFAKDRETVVGEHEETSSQLFGFKYNADHWRRVHDLGYLPLQFNALPEGTEVPLRVPMWTVQSTLEGFGWLTNWGETLISTQSWLPSTSATTALRFRRMLDGWADTTGVSRAANDPRGHDFALRGMECIEAGGASGAGHLLSFAGTDNLPAIAWARQFYGGCPNFVGYSVPATEHSVMCVGGQENELDTVVRLLEDQPDGYISQVVDTWDYFDFITNGLRKIKPVVMKRNGTFVVRPDSGDPADIVCGTNRVFRAGQTPEEKGTVEILWDIFGGTYNDAGFKVLDSHIGIIYGDSITWAVGNDIESRLAAKGFAITPVYGVGSFTYQYVTRDTFGFAMKATWAIVNGVLRPISKNPKTDSGLKRSAAGQLAVLPNLRTGEPYLVENASAWALKESLLRPVWKDGKTLIHETFPEIVARVGVRHLMPS